MKTFRTFYRNQPASRRTTFAVSSTATGCAILLLAASGAAGAADQPAGVTADSGQLEEVVVTGIRAAIESAISVKKNADSIVESISAEDIGKLPDTTIAESLARLPGVTTQRNNKGEATNVSIRGLGPDFNGYLLNGREQTSIGDSRAVDLSVYPAELIAGATVYKSGDASLMTAGLAGTIDNHLVNPLAYQHMIIAGTVEKTRNSVGISAPEGKGKRYSLSYIDQFADRKIGVALGFVHSDSNSSQLSNGSWGNSPAIYSGDINSTQIANGTGLPSVSVPFAGGLSFESDSTKDKRNGGAAIISFEPNDSFKSEVDAYYARIEQNTKKDVVKRGSNGHPITNATITNGVVVSGTFTMSPYDLIDYNENLSDDDTLQSVGWKNSLKLSDDWGVSLDLSRNSAKRIERDIEAYAGINAVDTLSFTNGGARVPSFTLGSPLSYTDPNVIAIHDAAGWSGVQYPAGSPYAGQTVPQAGYDKGPTVTDKLSAVRLEFTHDLGHATPFTTLQFGANYTKRTKDRITDEGLLVSPNNGGYDPIPFPGATHIATNVGGTGLNMLAFDPTAELWSGVVLLRKYNDDILSKTWSVAEKVTTGYAKFNIDSQAFGVPVRGNLGLQMVYTDQSSAGYRAGVNSTVTLTNPAGTLTTDGEKYSDFLPSLNLAADLGQGKIMRFAVSEQIARPSLTDLRNSLAASIDTSTGDCGPIVNGYCSGNYNTIVGSSGNPHLKPFKARAIDLSFEKYFETKAYVSAAVFYKTLETYITPMSYYGNYDFTTIASQLNIPIPVATTGLQPTPGGPLGTYTTTVNGSGGNLYGLELAASFPLDLVSSWLEGFGITGSYSSTISNVALKNLIGLNPSQPVPNNNQTIQLPGLSHINEKVVFYYERAGFSAFVAKNKRSEYIGSVANSTVGGYPSLTLIAPQTWISAQIGYEFQNGALKGLGLRFEGNNINKPIYSELHLTSPPSSTDTGASYALKLSYKFQ